MTIQKPPRASFLGLDFASAPADFTKKAIAKHGHVWEVVVGGIIGPRVFGIAGAEALKAFYNPENICRYPAANQHVLNYFWTSRGFPGLPPLDGPNHLVRKRNFLTLTTYESTEKLLQVTDEPMEEAIKAIGKDNQAFSFFDFSNRMVFGLFSKQWFGLGIDDWEGGARAEALTKAIQEIFAVVGDKDPEVEAKVEAKSLLTSYMEAVLAAVRARPADYQKSRLAAYLKTEETQMLNDDELIMDMFQVLASGTYGLVTHGTCSADALLEYPEVRAKVAAEVRDFHGPITIKNLLALKYTTAFVKEVLRWYPVVHSLVGYSLRDFTVEGMLVPANEKVMACLWGTLHDPTVFENPKRFDPERHMPPRNNGQQESWNDWSVVFGGGDGHNGHACAGKMVVLAHLVHMTTRLVQNWDFHKEDPDEKVVWPRCESHAENGLMLRRGAAPSSKPRRGMYF
ncbi:hypothetical protein WJX74_009114 [Apatococcus lobatus]|uniref:Cytochrome P450 n=1 Tax=Apatococcus lobatus TaxID=904363 RepID=A0AAW1QN72_9CHLO